MTRRFDWRLGWVFIAIMIAGTVLVSCAKKEAPEPAMSDGAMEETAPPASDGSTGDAPPTMSDGASGGATPPPATGIADSILAPAPSPELTVDRILEAMAVGNIAFNAPWSLNLKDTAQIQLLLSLEQSVEELRGAVTAEGEREGHQVRVSNRMEARLSGADFQITAITPEDQAITSRGVTEWKWEVKPVTRGPHHLHLTLTAVFEVDGTSTRRAIRTYDKVIGVEVTPGQQASEFLAKNWQWLWAAILIPLGGWLWKRWKNRGARQA
jgi:hypothetical protein